MKLSNRKQLLEEADMTLKSLLKEASPSQVEKLKQKAAEYDSLLNAAIAQLKQNKADIKAMVSAVENGTPIERSVVKNFWIYNDGSPVNKLMKFMKNFGDSVQTQKNDPTINQLYKKKITYR